MVFIYVIGTNLVDIGFDLWLSEHNIQTILQYRYERINLTEYIHISKVSKNVSFFHTNI